MENRRNADSEWGHLLAGRGRRRVITESTVAYALILAVIWTPRPYQRWLWWIAAAAVAFIAAISWDGAKAMGLRSTNFLRSLWVVGAALLMAAAGIAIALRAHTLKLPPGLIPFVAAYFAYAVWTFVQQFLLQGFFLLRFLRLFPAREAAFFSASLFALAHVPNPVLVPITFLWGLAACLLFLRYRNLYPLALAHAIFGITIAITVPGHVDHNMRVGLGYLTYARHFHKLPLR
jgi:membrane protease YdiL (CAAX protease family)